MAAAWRSIDGKWARVSDTPIRGQRRLFMPLADDDVPQPPPGPPLAALDKKFVENPVKFMCEHAVSPPHDGGAALGPELGRTNARPGEITSGDHTSPKMFGQITRNTAGGVRYTKLVPHAAPNFPGAVDLQFANSPGQPDTSWIPIHWLPWRSLHILQHTIPPVPSSLIDPPEEEYPRFFFTSGINGCSVFVKGDATSPTIYHAGIDGTLGRSAGQFWRDQMAATGANMANAGRFNVKGEANRDDYMFKDTRESELARSFLNWKSSAAGWKFDLDIQSSFGCVFGVRFGRHWSFYLQQSVTMQTVHFVKQDAIRQQAGNFGYTSHFEKGSDLPANRVVTQGRRHLGNIPLPMTKQSVTYQVVNRTSHPLRVTEIYPTSKWSGQLRDVFTSTTARI